ncbi:MAG: FG-GAP repeat protein, partial [Planctomycetaceae bacterium]|nr:FG-GAP repeat protein [Planctomycetaceae bacterium]
GEIGATFDFAFGFDTYGLSRFDPDLGNVGAIFDGFYVSDRINADGTGADVPEITLRGGLFAAAELNIIVARAGVGGGVYINVYFNLHDNNGDGKVRGREILDNLTQLGVIHIFDVSGKLTAELFAYLKIGFPTPFGFVTLFDQSFTLANVTLLDFSLPRPTFTPPPLAIVDGGVLRVTATEGDDLIAIRPTSNPNSVIVKSNGREETFSGISSIFFNGLGGNDTLVVDAAIALAVELHGGAGDDRLVAGGGPARLFGGPGKDELIGGPGNDEIYGGDGDDLLRGGGGHDRLEGGAGGDTLYGDDGDDVLLGSDGEDRLFGGRGRDWLDGGNHADLLSGDEGDDVLIGGLGADRLDGGLGDDLLVGDLGDVNTVTRTASNLSGAGDDEIFGGRGADRIYGGGGNDRIDGGQGVDVIFAGLGDDTVFGGSGADVIYGEEGHDTIYGEAGSDELHGGDGDDLIFGGFSETGGGVLGEINRIFGGDGHDRIYGDIDQDIIDAGAGNDFVDALAGDNIIHGRSGNNTLIAGSGNDLIDAEGGDDVIRAGDGENIIDAGDGHNFVRAGAGRDRILTGSGNDDIDAGDGGTSTQPQIVLAGEGHNVVVTGAGVDHITTGSGNDRIVAGAGSDLVIAGWGRDTIVAGVHENGGDSPLDRNIVFGDLDTDDPPPGNVEDHADTIYGGSGPDLIFAAFGSDFVSGGAGDDTIIAGPQNDHVVAGAGNDIVVGGQGDDLIFGNDGEDVLWGGHPGDAGLGWALSNDFGRSAFHLADASLFDFAPGFREAEDFAAQVFAAQNKPRPSYLAPRITPLDLLARSVDGVSDAGSMEGDGKDVLWGGAGTDWLFGGGDADLLDGGEGADYLDGGSGNDSLRGGEGDDVLRGGLNHDVLRGGAGIDQLYGDDGDDLLYGDSGTNGNQAGQRLWGGRGFDKLYAYADSQDIDSERWLVGDDLRGGGDGDLLFGNIRQDLLIGDSVTQAFGGNDFLHGDYLRGPLYERNTDAGRIGADDFLYGGFGQDQLFGGGGNDILYGGEDGDFLQGQGGDDQVYGGSGIDILVVDVDSRFEVGGHTQNDVYHGHYGNNAPGDNSDDGAADILLIEGDKSYYNAVDARLDDTILLDEFEDDGRLKLRIRYTAVAIGEPLREIVIDWRDQNETPLPGQPHRPVVEQFHVSGLLGNDRIAFNLRKETVDQLAANVPGRPWVAVISGGPGDDHLTGTPGRDRIDGGPGSDTLFGLAGDDRLWGDFFNGDPLQDEDVLFAGEGNDDLIGGSGANQLFAWTFHPQGELGPSLPSTAASPPTQFGVFVDPLGGRHTNDGDLDNDGFLDADGTSAPYVLEDTGLNRMLGSTNPLRADILYGGTGLDFLYGNGGGGPQGDQLITRHGVPFEDSDGVLAQDDQWKEYAKSTGNAWYLAGSDGNDVINIDFVTNPYNPLFGRHLVTFSTSGSFDPRFNGFDSFTAFDGDQPTHESVDAVTDAASVLVDPISGQSRTPLAAFERFQSMGISHTDIVERVFGPEADFLAIIIDALDGDDTIHVNETVQKSVWVDAGPGNDIVRIEPQLSFLPDATDAVGNRNDTRQRAFNLGTLVSGGIFTGLTIDSARSDEPDIDWYRFTLAAAPTVGDELLVTDVSGIRGAGLTYRIEDAAGNILGGISQLVAGVPYDLRVASPRAIPTEYEIRFRLTSTIDRADTPSPAQPIPNNTPETARVLNSIHRISRVTGLTLHNASDVDYFRFTLAGAAGVDDAIRLESFSDQPVSLELIRVEIDGTRTSVVVQPAAPAATLSLAGQPAGDYLLRVSGGPARYELVPQIRQSAVGNNSIRESAYEIIDFTQLEPVRQNLLSQNDAAWFRFGLQEPADNGQMIGLRSLNGANEPNRDNQLALELINARGEIVAIADTGTEGLAQLDISNLGGFRLIAAASPVAGVNLENDLVATIVVNDISYAIGLSKASTATNATIADLVADLNQALRIAFAATPFENTLKFEALSERIALTANESEVHSLKIDGGEALGFGPGQSARASETGRYWLRVVWKTRPAGETSPARFELFSTTASVDRRLEDLSGGSPQNLARPLAVERRDVILGGPGNDRLQGGSGEDWIFGGAGNDVLTGGLDRQAKDLLFGGEGDDIFQVWTDWLLINPATGRPGDPGQSDLFVGGPGDDQVVFLGGNLDANGTPVRDYVLLGYDRFLHRHRISTLVWDAGNQVFLTEAHLNPELNPTGTTLIDQSSSPFLQKYAFFHARDVERTVIDTGDGVDVVHADPGFVLNNQTWGISRGDVQARATAFTNVEIHGGDGKDWLFGGASNDVIFGGDNRDFIAGGEGDDHLFGEDGDDEITGNRTGLPLVSNGIPTSYLSTVFSEQPPSSPESPSIKAFVPQNRRDFTFEVLDEPGRLQFAPPLADNRPRPAGLRVPENSTTVSVENAFALEGVARQLPSSAFPGGSTSDRSNGQPRLNQLIAVGDVNGDRFPDYVLSGESGDSYLLLGPLGQGSLHRVTMQDTDGDEINEFRLRGDQWIADISFDIAAHLSDFAHLFRAEGRADAVLHSSLGRPALRMGDVLTTARDVADNVSRNDLLFVADTGAAYQVTIIAGAPELPRGVFAAESTIQTRTITVPKSLAPTVADVQVHVLNFTGGAANEILVLGKGDASGNGALGYVFSSSSLTGNITQSSALLTIRGDGTNRSDVLGQQYSQFAGYVAQSAAGDHRAIVAGDVNGDGWDDLLIGDQRFISTANGPGAPSDALPNIGRVYLLLGRPSASGELRLHHADAIWQDFGLGAGVFDVGDINNDGYADLAFTRSVEGTRSSGPAPVEILGSAFVLAGSGGYGSGGHSTTMFVGRPGTASVGTKNVGLVEIRRELAADTFAHSRLQITQGDFDGDARADLALGDAAIFHSSSPGWSTGQTGLAAFAGQGRVSLFSGATTLALQTHVVGFGQATGVLEGESEGDGFGTLSATPLIDLDGDGLDDLIVGAPGATVHTGVTTSNSGRVYVVSGQPKRFALPVSGVELITNRDVPRSGLYLVEQPTGEPFRYLSQLPVAQSPATGAERWYRFSTLGDGQIGDQIRLLIPEGGVESISRPQLPRPNSTVDHPYSTSFVDPRLPQMEIPLFEDQAHGVPKAAGTLLPDLSGGYTVLLSGANGAPSLTYNTPEGPQTIDALEIGGPSQRVAVIELDLSRFLSYVEYPQGIAAARFEFPYQLATAVAGGSITVEVLDREADGFVTPEDGSRTADRFRPLSLNIDPSGRPSHVDGPFVATIANGLQHLDVDLTQEVRDALSVGHTRLMLRISTDVTAGTFRIAAPGLGSPTQFEIETLRRGGVVADVFDGEGRRLAEGLSLIDTRSFPAGDFSIRVYDPFADPNHRLYDPGYQRDAAIDFVLEIEPPKVGDADAPSDRDEIHGGQGDDVIAGGAYRDRLFGFRGRDVFAAEAVEVRDLAAGYSFIDFLEATSGPFRSLIAPASGQESSNIPRPDDFEIEFASPALALRIGESIGLTIVTPDGHLTLRRPLRASDLTQLLELDASYLGISDISGLEYAVNLQYLSLAGNVISDISLLQPGLRPGREEQ